jgi:hypothetical protein
MRKNERKALTLSRETLKNLDLDPILLKKLNGGVCLTSVAQTTCPGCVRTLDC